MEIVDPPTQEKKAVHKNLLDRAGAFTERKEASNMNGSAGITSAAKEEFKFSGNKSSPFWHEEPVVEENKPPIPDKASTTPAASTDTASTENKLKYTRARAEASAEITTAGLDNLQQLIFNILENIRYKRKFKPAEIKRIVEKDLIDFARFNDLPPGMEVNDKILWKKWDNQHKKHLKKLSKIPFDTQEKKNTREMFISYQEYKQETLSPAWGIGIQMVNIFASRAIEIYMED